MKKKTLDFLNNLYDELRDLRKQMDKVLSKYEEEVGEDEISELLTKTINRAGLIQFRTSQIRMEVEKIGEDY